MCENVWGSEPAGTWLGLQHFGRLLSTLEERGCPWARGVLQMTCGVDCEVQPLDWFDYTLGFVSVFLLDFD